MVSRHMRTLLYPLIALGLFGADWPQFRGPNGSGLCPSCRQLPTEFGPLKNVLGRTFLPAALSSTERSFEAQTRLAVVGKKGTVQSRWDHETEASRRRIDRVRSANREGCACVC